MSHVLLDYDLDMYAYTCILVWWQQAAIAGIFKFGSDTRGPGQNCNSYHVHLGIQQVRLCNMGSGASEVLKRATTLCNTLSRHCYRVTQQHWHVSYLQHICRGCNAPWHAATHCMNSCYFCQHCIGWCCFYYSPEDCLKTLLTRIKIIWSLSSEIGLLT